MSVDLTIPPKESRRLALWAFAFAVLAMLCAAFGLVTAYRPTPSWPYLADAARILYAAAGLLVFEPPSADMFDVDGAEPGLLALARFFVVVFAMLTSITLLLTFSRTVATHRTQFVFWLQQRLARRELVIVCGLGPLGRQILEDLRPLDDEDPKVRGSGQRGRPNVVAIEPAGERSGIDAGVRHGALTLVGDPRNRRVRIHAMIRHAGTVYVVTGDDAMDIAIASEILHDFQTSKTDPVRRGRGAGRLTCRVHVEDHELVRALAEHGLSPAPGVAVRVQLFSLRDEAARVLLLDPENGLASRYVPRSDEVAHYFVFGFGAAGTSIATQLARLAHFTNLRRPRITILDAFESDDSVREARDRFLAQHPAFSPAVDLAQHAANPDPTKDDWDYRAGSIDAEWSVNDPDAVEYVTHAEFCHAPGGTDSPAMLALLRARLQAVGSPVRPAILVCFDDERRNVRTALRVRELLESLPHASLPDTVPIFVYVTARETAALLHGHDAHPRMPIHSFSHHGTGRGYQTRMQSTLDAIAVELHRAYARVSGVPVPKDYDALPPLLRASNEEAAVHALVKLLSIGCRITDVPNPGGVTLRGERTTLARVEHNRWMAERLLAGWRYGRGDDRDELTRQRRRSALRSWDALDDTEKLKDFEQVDELLAALHAAGRGIEPRENEVQPASGDSAEVSAGTTR